VADQASRVESGQGARMAPLSAVLLECRAIFGTDEVLPTSNFFEIGGSSLDAVELVGRLSENRNLVVGLEAVFSASTLESIAAACKEGS